MYIVAIPGISMNTELYATSTNGKKRANWNHITVLKEIISFHCNEIPYIQAWKIMVGRFA